MSTSLSDVEVPQTLHEFLALSGASWSERDIVASITQLIGPQTLSGTVELPADERQLWAQYSGISEDEELAKQADRRALSETAAQSIMALTGEQVGVGLGLKPSTIRHYRTENRLYAYMAEGKAWFPIWQFSPDLSSALPGLAEVLGSLDARTHPRSVAGFFSTVQSELVIAEVAVSPRDWLLGGGSPAEVVALASEVGLGL
ncbi:hypothetical protein [Subtercola endophyticus]|uniref:hypothetical protein n=1 Tax=Subtercola endophyticus TaxID=2895559 RepID=UPI001E3111DF|nr:hypothetical protein [Subtercola endophyticus]UFS60551.1 hypothetical protein LQ955_07370 [Subtercola endophyticus]